MQKKYIFIIIIIAFGAVVWAWMFFQKKSSLPANVENQPISQVDYLCDGGKTINAKYYKGPEAPTVQPGEMPTPTGSVEIFLSDGRQLSLAQTISGSGIRYATSNEAIIFWSKGNSAFIMENDMQTYSSCVAVALDPGNLPQVYASSTLGFSIRYPLGYTIDTSYVYQELGPGKDINGVKFIIPVEMATGTNLSGFDTGISVETIPNSVDCNASLFLDLGNSGAPAETIDNDVQYSVATSTGAGAGNFYEETVWAIRDTNPCVAVRYFIHSTNIDNYPEGAVKEFNHQALIDQFDAVRKSLVLSP
ncbi:MAG: MliC family protein [Candidatus Pacebacteria bacterium]|nr:MliC family protein [Candidatus Paceibacterota bacterium]